MRPGYLLGMVVIVGLCAGSAWAADTDGDGVPDASDNAPYVWNPGQEDWDSDGVGDVADNAPNVWNPEQRDYDSDGVGDVADNAPLCSNPTQEDSDADYIGDVYDPYPFDGNLPVISVIAKLGGPYTVTPGNPIILDVSGSDSDFDDYLGFWLDLDGDGDYRDADKVYYGVDLDSITVPWDKVQAFGLDSGTHNIWLKVGAYNGTATDMATVTPEPATLALLALGGLGVLIDRRRK